MIYRDYDPDTKFTFGKFKGKTLNEVWTYNSSYINWCIVNLENFYISEDTILEIRNRGYKISLSKDAINSLASKKIIIEEIMKLLHKAITKPKKID